MSLDLQTTDVLKWATEYSGPKFHAMLCDPPYHLQSIVKRFSSPTSRGAIGGTVGGKGSFGRMSRGFMGQSWDGGDLAFKSDTWSALGQHLHPGAFAFAFASSRGLHRMMCAMEDAGFIIQPTVFLFGFGTGMPKATRVRGADGFDGHRYGGQALKPACEPVVCVQWPYVGRAADCIRRTGAGTLNIDAGRIRAKEVVGANGRWGFREDTGWHANSVPSRASSDFLHERGRWPSNLIVDEYGAAVIDAQTHSYRTAVRRIVRKKESAFMHGIELGEVFGQSYGDSGGISRVFYRSDWNTETSECIEGADKLFYTSKVGVSEREAGMTDAPGSRQNNHPTLKPLKLCRYLAGLLLPPAEYGPRRIMVPFAGAGSECIGADLAGWEEIVGIEQSAEYSAIARARFDYWKQNSGIFDLPDGDEDCAAHPGLFEDDNE